MATVLDELTDVEFYTALDPYYYVVDNRPLKNLDDNIRLIATATDASVGGISRTAMAAASAAYATLGYGDYISGDPVYQAQGMFTSSYTTSGLSISFLHGHLVRPLTTNSYVEPRIAIHDKVTTLTVQAGRGGTVQARYRSSLDTDRVPSSDSNIEVCEISFKQGSVAGSYPTPDAGYISIMHINVPTGAVQILDSYITMTNMRSIDEVSDPVGSSTLSYSDYVTDVLSGASAVPLSGSGIDTTNIGAVEVFIQGVNQFNWTYSSGTNQILLEAPLTADAEVRVRQLSIER